MASIRGTIAAALAIALCSLATSATSLTQERTCEVAHRSVSAFLVEHGSRASLADLRALVASLAPRGLQSREIAKAYVASLDAAGKSKFWREYVGSFLVQPLSSAQRFAINGVKKRLTRSLFERAALDTSAVSSELDEIRALLGSAFSEADAAVISGRAWDAFDAPVLPSLKQRHFVPLTEGAHDCTCNTDHDYCYGQFFCLLGPKLPSVAST